MTSSTRSLLALDALGANGSYHALNHEVIPDVSGEPVAELSLVPSLFTDRTVAALRAAKPAPADERIASIARAGELFRNAVLGGLPPDEYCKVVSRVSGLPITMVANSMRVLHQAAGDVRRNVRAALPNGAVEHWQNDATLPGCATWCRRGEVLAVLAAGNHPGVHSHWLEALALGYRVAVRPSRHEPFTPHRMVLALREAGFGDDQVALLPTDHRTSDALAAAADLAIVYGGEEVARKHSGDPGVLTQGPGRSKILITRDVDWQEHLDVIVDSIAAEAGTACVNATAVLVEGDPAPLAAAIASRLERLPSLPADHPDAVLPTMPSAQAEKLSSFLRTKTGSATAFLGSEGVADDLGDGSAALRPAVLQPRRGAFEQIGIELPFPCVWVASWSPDDGVGPLRDTLVLTALTRDDDLIESLVDEPTIANVYVGDRPTHWFGAGVPHDSFLADFLMRTKGMSRTW